MAPLLLATTFLFIRHGGRGIKGESCSTLLMLRLAQQRASYVCTNVAIYRVDESDFAFSTREIFYVKENTYIEIPLKDCTKSYVRTTETIVFLKVFKNLFSSFFKFYHVYLCDKALYIYVQYMEI